MDEIFKKVFNEDELNQIYNKNSDEDKKEKIEKKNEDNSDGVFTTQQG